MKNKQIVLFLILMITICTCACSGADDKEDEDDSLTAVLEVGGTKVYMDEIKYYAYTKQASHEAYYIAYGQEVDWQEDVDSEKTLEETVKDIVLNEICKRTIVNNHADKYNVTLDESDMQEAKDMVETYFSDSASALISAIGITEDRLTEVFEYQKLYEKVCLKYMEKNGTDISIEECVQARVSVITVADEEKAQTIASKILKEIKSGADINDVAEKYNCEAAEGNIGAGDRDGDELEELCLSLASGDVDMFCEDETYYVVYCISDYDGEATDAAYEQLLSEAKDAAAAEIYNIWKDSDSIKINESEWDKITFDIPIFTLE